jgi:GNAT superfamily N-acetyltransferase
MEGNEFQSTIAEVEGVTIRPVTPEDAEILSTLKIEFLEAIIGAPMSEEKRVFMRELLVPYFAESITSGEYIGRIAEEKGVPAGTGGVVIYKLPPFTMGMQSGRKGYVMNIFTCPDFRRRGICRAIMQWLKKDAHAAGVEYLHLHATDMGIDIYRSLGYQEPHQPELVLRLT